jgi:hypothetical protein
MKNSTLVAVFLFLMIGTANAGKPRTAPTPTSAPTPAAFQGGLPLYSWGVVTPAAAANTFGAPVTATAEAPFHYLDPAEIGYYVETIGAETLTIRVVANLVSGGGSEYLDVTTSGTGEIDPTRLQISSLGSPMSIVSVEVEVESSIPNSTASVAFLNHFLQY